MKAKDKILANIPAILLLISLSANFIDLSYYFIGNVAGYSIIVCIALLDNPRYSFPQRMFICGLLTMNVIGLMCYFLDVDYNYLYDLGIASVIVAISVLRLKKLIHGNLGDNY